jgi:hypothetical protein
VDPFFIGPVTLGEQGKLADLGAKHEKSSAAARIRHCTLSLLQWTVCDEDGKPLFSAEDLAGLMGKSSSSAFLRLQDAVLKFSGLTEESRRELEKKLADRADRRARFRLALELGRTVAELEATLSMPEWIEWLAYFRQESGNPKSATSSWQSQMRTMRLISDLQRTRG